MKILIIEDEKHNASRLQRILSEISPTFETVGVLESIERSVILLSVHLPFGLAGKSKLICNNINQLVKKR